MAEGKGMFSVGSGEFCEFCDPLLRMRVYLQNAYVGGNSS